MIHLTIQDVALLANLADCCNTVEEFKEYVMKTHGWGSTPLSARSDYDGEFVISYGSLNTIKLEAPEHQFATTYNTVVKIAATPPKDDQFLGAYNTIQNLKFKPELSYRAGGYGGLSSISYQTGARSQADLAMRIYGGLQKLSLSKSTDYRVGVYGGIWSFRFSRPEPLMIGYHSLKLIDDQSKRSGLVATYASIKGARLHRLENLKSYMSVEDIVHPSTETTASYISIKQNTHKSQIEAPFSYTTLGQIEHVNWDQSDMPVDHSVVYASVGVFEHTNVTLDYPITYTSIGLLEHVRKDKSDTPIDIPVSYTSIGLLEHVHKDESDTPIDLPVSYATIKHFEHVHKDESDVPIDFPVSYTTVKHFEHVNWDNSDSPVDLPITYATAHRIEHVNWDEGDVPIDLPITYTTIGRLDAVRWDKSDQPIDRMASLGTLGTFNEQQQLDPACTYGTLGDMLFNQPSDNTISYFGTQHVFTFNPKQRLNMYLSFAHVDVYTTHENAKSYGSLSEALLLPHRECFVTYQTLRDVPVTPAGDMFIAYNTTHNVIQQRGDVLQLYKTVERLDLFKQGEKFKTYNTVDRIKHIQGDRLSHYRSIKNIKNNDRSDRSTSYSTVGNLIAKDHVNVFCDSQKYTWAASDSRIDTTVGKYYMPRNNYGISKFRIQLLPNELQNQPWNQGTLPTVQLSKIRAILDDGTVYPLSGADVHLDNCGGGCPVGTSSLTGLFTDEFATTVHQLTSYQDSYWCTFEMLLCFHLSATEPIKYIELAPGGCFGEPKAFPGHVRIDCYYPGTEDWFNVYAHQTYRHAISGADDHNQGNRVWRVGEYMRFPLVNNNELYENNHIWKTKILACPQ